MSEFLRVEQGNGQVSEQKNGKEKSDGGNQVHDLPQLLTRLYVEEGDGEKQGCEKQHGQVLHRRAPHSGKPREAVTTGPASLRSRMSLPAKSFHWPKENIRKL
jgi:hypothetical protein